MPSAMWLTLTWEEASAPPWMLHTSFRAVSYILTGGSTTPAVAAAASTSMASSPAAPAAITAVSSHVKVSSSFIPNAASMRLLAPINSLSPTVLPLNPKRNGPRPAQLLGGNVEQTRIELLGILLHGLSLRSGPGEFREGHLGRHDDLGGLDGLSGPVEAAVQIAEGRNEHRVALVGQAGTGGTAVRGGAGVAHKGFAQRVGRAEALDDAVEVARVAEVDQSGRFRRHLGGLLGGQILEEDGLDLGTGQLGGRSHEEDLDGGLDLGVVDRGEVEVILQQSLPQAWFIQEKDGHAYCMSNEWRTKKDTVANI